MTSKEFETNKHMTRTKAIEILGRYSSIPMSGESFEYICKAYDFGIIGLEKIKQINDVIIAEDLDDEKRIELINEIVTTCWWRENK